MSAVIVSLPQFARSERQRNTLASERLRVVREAVALRATSTHASSMQRRQALVAAVTELQGGGTAGAAIQKGYDALPSIRCTSYRQPTGPGTAA